MIVVRIKYIFIFFVIFLILFTGNFFSYKNWNPTLAGHISYFIYIIPLFTIFVYPKIIRHSSYNFRNFILALTFIPFLSSFNSYIIYNQSFITSIKVLFPNFIWLIYFGFHKYKIDEKTIIKLAFIFVVATLFLQIFQQINPSKALFGIRTEDEMELRNYSEIVEQRNGLYRFRLGTYYLFAMLIVFYYWSNYKLINSKYKLVYIVISLTSIYLTLTRQILATTIVTLLLSVFLVRNKKIKIWIYTISIVFSIIIINYSDILFGQMIEATHEHLSGEFMRFYAYTFFWEKIDENFLTLIIGNGMPGSKGEFFRIFSNWQDNLLMYTSDIGIIGQWFHFGLIYILIYLRIVQVIFFKKGKYIPLYIKLFFIATFFTIPMIFPFSVRSKYIVWCMVFYLCDLYINKKLNRLN